MNLLKSSLEERILVLDGAMGTALQSKGLGPQDFGGPSYEGCNENLVLTRPEIIQSIHAAYLEAGCDIVETNTFGATPLVLGEYELSTKCHEINFRAAKLAFETARSYSQADRPRFVAGSIGPTTKAISVTGGISFEDLKRQFHAQALGLIEGGVDYLLLETCQDTRNTKAAILAIQQAMTDLSVEVPIAVSCTIEANGTMLAGQTADSFLASLSHLDLLYIGLNCATGPELMADHIRSLSTLTRTRIACVPNAGLPNADGKYPETPEDFAHSLSHFLKNGWLNLIGGCCGTHAGHIKALSKLSGKYTPRRQEVTPRSVLSGVDLLEITDEMRPVIVGERTNVIGSRKFKTLITEGKLDEASELARSQIRGGAQIIDVCLANPDRDELADMRDFMEQAIRKVRVPFMLDSTDPDVIELGLTYCQGKAIINSVNLEDGEHRITKIAALARKFGAALVVGCIDDDPVQGMGITRQRKLEIARREFELLTMKCGILAEDIYFDPLVFPCATGDAQYEGSAAETIEGVRLIKQNFPLCKTVLGISNVSFGLPVAGREILNSVFLYHCVQAGLDLAIVNAEKIERYAGISERDRVLAEDLLFNRGNNPTAAFADAFRDRKETKKERIRSGTPSERLSQYIVEGSKDGLLVDLAEALKTLRPLEIINGPLMQGMDEVGRLFNSNQLIVAEVLQSAEVMKAAVLFLEPHMDKNDITAKNRVLLATVKGDVHDIGKNLVDIIFSNNGFEVIDLGIRVGSEQIIQAIRKHDPKILGLSGLLVKSAHQMAATAVDLREAGINVPLLVGGAALSAHFVDQSIATAYPGTVAYARDAMSGLDLAKAIVNPARFETLKTELATRRSQKGEKEATEETTRLPGMLETTERSSQIDILNQVPNVKQFGRKVLTAHDIETIWTFINPLMLYGRHLGIGGGVVRKLEKMAAEPALRDELLKTEPKALAVWDAVAEVKREHTKTELFKPAAILRFFGAASDGNRLVLFNNDQLNKEIGSFNFSRQPLWDGVCLSDYVQPLSLKRSDNMAAFVVTIGKGVRKYAGQLKERGDYLKSHIIQALAIESAEAYAEFLHQLIRDEWGFSDPAEMTMMDRFRAKYRGRRYSFGYPACPRLDDQQLLFDLLQPTEIGVQLTEGMMMDPEASVSALVFHHPQATYFSVGQRGGPIEDNR
ncbi:MAG TPA: methionine synthase [Bdellovibrionales bacterium]|nr:MAG: methionine synthase [Bdellovibrionales bacterium GWA1_52_35]OFZ36960.1 MAG: methionine synthase [Bdellovibrionales bacterium GWC1_52_8]HAR42339.1 methionine synthase [Bdellovibrionales bacterium]HCM39916.1 methionine synthase [Bdellovibrionales bacterium]